MPTASEAPDDIPPRIPSPVGRLINVEVVSVGPSEFEVKLADGRLGVVAKADFADEPSPSVGSKFEVALLAREDPLHRVPLSRSWAVKQRAWERLEAAKAAGEPLTGPVVKSVKGGLVVDLGVRAFLPASLIFDRDGGDAAALVGTDVTVVVSELERSADRVVVSRRDHLRRVRRVSERESFSRLAIGQRVRGTVTQLVEYGAYVDLEGARALLHRSEMSWTRVNRPDDVVAVGQEVDVVVVELNRSKRRIGVSLRQVEGDPLDAVEVGASRGAVITRVVDYGAFATLDDTDVIGLIHMTELTDLPGSRPDQLVTPGESVIVKVLSIDRAKRRVSLSLRQALWA